MSIGIVLKSCKCNYLNRGSLEVTPSVPFRIYPSRDSDIRERWVFKVFSQPMQKCSSKVRKGKINVTILEFKRPHLSLSVGWNLRSESGLGLVWVKKRRNLQMDFLIRRRFCILILILYSHVTHWSILNF